jgi:hypothetical protein
VKETAFFTVYSVLLNDKVEWLQVIVTNETEIMPYTLRLHYPLVEADMPLNDEERTTIERLNRRVKRLWDELDGAIRQKTRGALVQKQKDWRVTRTRSAERWDRLKVDPFVKTHTKGNNVHLPSGYY